MLPSFLFLVFALSSQKIIVPTDGMEIKESCEFEKNEYHFENGVSIVADNVIVNMGGSTLIGEDFKNVGISSSSFKNVSIINGQIRNYYYAIRIEESEGVLLDSLDVSYNYFDPHVFDKQPPWLDINITPDRYGDLTNFGGGIWFNKVKNSRIHNCVAEFQENGMDLFFCKNVQIRNSQASNNVGWGIHLYKSTENLIVNNVANNCTRKGPYPEYTADTAGLLLNCESSNNKVIGNQFLYGGGFPREKKNECCPSNNNLFDGNDCSFSPNNAIEDTFSTGNTFKNNICNGSNYGFWLGYSHGNLLELNIVNGSKTAGVAIEHGQNNTMIKNRFTFNGKGVFLWTDFIDHFPSSDYECLYLPDPKHSTEYQIFDNFFINNVDQGITLYNTTKSLIYNNYFEGEKGHTALDGQEGDMNEFYVQKIKRTNIVGGPYVAGNYWADYSGKDTTGDGIGNTDVPYLANGNLKEKFGDNFPIVKQKFQ